MIATRQLLPWVPCWQEYILISTLCPVEHSSSPPAVYLQLLGANQSPIIFFCSESLNVCLTSLQKDCYIINAPGNAGLYFHNDKSKQPGIAYRCWKLDEKLPSLTSSTLIKNVSFSTFRDDMTKKKKKEASHTTFHFKLQWFHDNSCWFEFPRLENEIFKSNFPPIFRETWESRKWVGMTPI